MQYYVCIMNLIWKSLCFIKSGKVKRKKKWRCKNWKNFNLEKDMNCNYLHVPYLENILKPPLHVKREGMGGGAKMAEE